LLLDEGAPADVGKTFQQHGHEVIPFEEVVKRGSDDVIVWTAAIANEAILVGFDNDMKAAARRYGIYGDRFKRLSIIKFVCPEPMAAKRLAFAMSLIEHEWIISTRKSRSPAAY
jgi:Domain of unknown function (DUF5615)